METPVIQYQVNSRQSLPELVLVGGVNRRCFRGFTLTIGCVEPTARRSGCAENRGAPSFTAIGGSHHYADGDNR